MKIKKLIYVFFICLLLIVPSSLYAETISQVGGGSSTMVNGKAIYSGVYSDASGNSAYCLNPGQKFNGSYSYQATTIDITTCSSGNNSYMCSLASLEKVTGLGGYSEDEKQHAMRLLAGHFNTYGGSYAPSGIEGEVAEAPNGSYYLDTARAIDNGGYSGSTTDPGKNILYGPDIPGAVDLYKKALATSNEIANNYKTGGVPWNDFVIESTASSIKVEDGKVIYRGSAIISSNVSGMNWMNTWLAGSNSCNNLIYCDNIQQAWEEGGEMFLLRKKTEEEMKNPGNSGIWQDPGKPVQTPSIYKSKTIRVRPGYFNSIDGETAFYPVTCPEGTTNSNCYFISVKLSERYDEALGYADALEFTVGGMIETGETSETTTKIQYLEGGSATQSMIKIITTTTPLPTRRSTSFKVHIDFDKPGDNGNTCKKIDGKFYGKGGTEVTEEQWYQECTCNNPELDSSVTDWTDRLGNKTDKKGWEDSCTCNNPEVQEGVKDYTDLNGQVTDKEGWEKVCKLKCNNPKTGLPDKGWTDNFGNPIEGNTEEEKEEKWKAVCAPPEPKICTFDEDTGLYYDRDGAPTTDYLVYEKSCFCVVIGNDYYYYYPDGPDKAEYDRRCTDYCKDPGVDYDGMIDDCDDNNGEGTIKDPEICGIINREAINNFEQDHLTSYGNDYCSIYCREELDFKFMDKETALAGQSFKHHVRGKYLGNEKNYSMVILSTRQCFSTVNYESWKEKYIASNNEVLNTWNKLKRWEAFYNLNNGRPTSTETDPGDSADHKRCAGGATIYAEWGYTSYNTTSSNGRTSTSSEHIYSEGPNAESSCSSGSHTCYERCNCTTDEKGKEVCSRCPYDCETCRCTCAVSVDTGIVSREYNIALSNYKNALKVRDELLYDIMDCNFMNTYTNDEKTPSYQTKGFYTTTKAGDYPTGASLDAYQSLIDNFADPKVGITYDEVKSKYGTYDIQFGKNDLTIGVDKSDPKIPSESPTTYSKAGLEEWNTYCGSGSDFSQSYCNKDTGNKFSPDSKMESLSYWDCEGSGTNATCKNVNVTVPENKLVNMKVEKEFGYYLDQKFSTQQLTGIVKTRSNTESSTSYWINLDDYVWPVSVKRDTRLGNQDYDIDVNYSNLNSKDRNQTLLFEYRTENANNSLLCGYHVKNETTGFECIKGLDPLCPDEPSDGPSLGLYFRTIDLTNVFPNSRVIGSNWTTSNAVQVIDQIQKLGDQVYVNKEYQYKITLTPSDIKAIQKYNKSKENEGGYLNYSITKDGLNTESKFLKNDLKDILGSRYQDLYKKNTVTGLYDYRR